MSDPLSIAAGVVGLITAAAQISSLLIKFSKQVYEAPEQARIVLTEVGDLSTILCSLQNFILQKQTVDRSRKALLPIDPVVVIVSGCVSTFSELQQLLDEMDLVGAGSMNTLGRLKWTKNEKQLSTLIQRLQTHKASLSLILTILNGETIEEAKLSLDRLCTFVDESYQDISKRLRKIEEIQCQWRPAVPISLPQENMDIVSTNSIRSSSEDIQVSNGAYETAFGYAFDQDLQNSIVYRRTAFRGSASSLQSRDGHATTGSILSGLSFADVSQISVISLAITSEEVYKMSAEINGTDLVTDISRRTDRTSYSIPEDGSPVTISTSKRKDHRHKENEHKLSRGSHQSQTSLLIEYFEGGKGPNDHSRPSVRVKIVPSSARKSKDAKDHIQITEAGGSRKPSYTRRILLGPKGNSERIIESDEKSITLYTSAADSTSPNTLMDDRDPGFDRIKLEVSKAGFPEALHPSALSL